MISMQTRAVTAHAYNHQHRPKNESHRIASHRTSSHLIASPTDNQTGNLEQRTAIDNSATAINRNNFLRRTPTPDSISSPLTTTATASPFVRCTVRNKPRPNPNQKNLKIFRPVNGITSRSDHLCRWVDTKDWSLGLERTDQSRSLHRRSHLTHTKLEPPTQ